MFKKLNEQIENFINEDNLNEISYETKRSYLAKRKAQLDAAKKAFDKANRLVKHTELAKDNNAEGDPDVLQKILQAVKDSEVLYNNRRFGYIENLKTWAFMETGDLSNDDNVKHCKITLAFRDGYLKVSIKTNNPWNTDEELFNMNELSSSKLINKASAYIIKMLKEKAKQSAKDDKIFSKIQKVMEQIKAILSKAKEDKLEGNKYKNRILFTLQPNNRRAKIPAVISVTANLAHINGHHKDLEVKAIGMDMSNLKLVIFANTEEHGIDIFYIHVVADSLEPQDLYNGLLTILEQLKENVKGRSNLKAQQKKLEDNKKLAEKAAEELRTQIKLNAGYGCDVERVKENGNCFEIATTDFGTWGTDQDWKEDNDFMRPTKETIDTLETLCKNFNQQYPTLKVSYGISEKRMLSFYVEYTL